MIIKIVFIYVGDIIGVFINKYCVFYYFFDFFYINFCLIVCGFIVWNFFGGECILVFGDYLIFLM